MHAQFARTYVKKETGNDVFVYSVIFNNEQEHESFKAAQGSNYRVDQKTGEILYFTTRYFGETINLIITSNNKVVADTSAFAKAKSLSAQYGGNFGQELARASADSLIAGMLRTQPSATPQADAANLPS